MEEGTLDFETLELLGFRRRDETESERKAELMRGPREQDRRAATADL